MDLTPSQIIIRKCGQVLGLFMFPVAGLIIAYPVLSRIEALKSLYDGPVDHYILYAVLTVLAGFILLLPFERMIQQFSTKIFIIVTYSVISILSLFIWPYTLFILPVTLGNLLLFCDEYLFLRSSEEEEEDDEEKEEDEFPISSKEYPTEEGKE